MQKSQSGIRGAGIFTSRCYVVAVEFAVPFVTVLRRGWLAAQSSGAAVVFVPFDAKDYAQNGELYVYNKNGVATDSVKVGITPGTIMFKQ